MLAFCLFMIIMVSAVSLDIHGRAGLTTARSSRLAATSLL